MLGFAYYGFPRSVSLQWLLYLYRPNATAGHSRLSPGQSQAQINAGWGMH